MEKWPYNYTELFKKRQNLFIKIAADTTLQLGAIEYYKDRPVEFINDWCITYDPRNVSKDLPTIMPFKLFKRQEELVECIVACINGEGSILVEKCRDMGATWVCSGISTWLWRFHEGSAVGWGSRKEQLVDKIGDPDSIFEKIRMMISYLPDWLKPAGFNINKHCSFMKIINPENGAIISGEAGDNIGRGGRKLVYFKDESAHYERPDRIEAALGDNTNCQIDISSVHGIGNVFHRRRFSGVIYEPDKEIQKDVVQVFVMDWRDHPAKSQEWYDNRRSKAEREGLLHVFNQEIDRDYTSAVEGILIPGKWVKAAIDAHIKLGFGPEGQERVGFDPYDEGADSHGLVGIRGSVFTFTKKWSDGDTGQATRKVVRICHEKGINWIQYDGIGVGAGVKSEANRLKDENLLSGNLKIVSWKSSHAVQDPTKRIIEVHITDSRDELPPMNKDFYKNLKAQGYWQLRRRFENTYKAITQGEIFPHEELISIPSGIENRAQLENELSQPTYSEDSAGRIIVDKTPEGTKSPNLSDSAVMAHFKLKTFDMSVGSLSGPSGSKTERVA
jgi:phage terminase large subunit